MAVLQNIKHKINYYMIQQISLLKKWKPVANIIHDSWKLETVQLSRKVDCEII
jgi:hypothetical protein